MSKSDIGVIIMLIIALLIFIILSIYSIKCLSREAQKTLVGICNTISSIGCTICLIWLLCFFLGCLIKIPYIITGVFFLIFGISVIISLWNRIIKCTDKIFLADKIAGMVYAIIFLIIGIILIVFHLVNFGEYIINIFR